MLFGGFGPGRALAQRGYVSAVAGGQHAAFAARRQHAYVASVARRLAHTRTVQRKKGGTARTASPTLPALPGPQAVTLQAGRPGRPRGLPSFVPPTYVPPPPPKAPTVDPATKQKEGPFPKSR